MRDLACEIRLRSIWTTTNVAYSMLAKPEWLFIGDSIYYDGSIWFDGKEWLVKLSYDLSIEIR